MGEMADYYDEGYVVEYVECKLCGEEDLHWEDGKLYDMYCNPHKCPEIDLKGRRQSVDAVLLNIRLKS